MAQCPMCGSKLQVVQWRWITNVLGLTKPYFICPMCKWKMTIKEVNERGGLHGIKDGLRSGKGTRNPLATAKSSSDSGKSTTTSISRPTRTRPTRTRPTRTRPQARTSSTNIFRPKTSSSNGSSSNTSKKRTTRSRPTRSNSNRRNTRRSNRR